MYLIVIIILTLISLLYSGHNAPFSGTKIQILWEPKKHFCNFFYKKAKKHDFNIYKREVITKKRPTLKGQTLGLKLSREWITLHEG